MNVGICFGGYCPLHKGHMDLIMQSKKQNDLTFVFVCGYDNEPRANIYDIPLMKRYRIISNFLSSEVVKVDYINDTELGLDESMSNENWEIWTRHVFDLITERYKVIPSKITWYIGEPSYKEQLEKTSWIRKACPYVKEKCVLIDRSKNKISGTMIRENPIKYWSNIAVPFRAYFSHNILITGTASEGKTTLTSDIGKYFGLPYSYEKGRDICLLKTDPEFTVKDFMYNIYEQHKYNEELICSPWNPGVFISDTDNFVTLMYAKAYAERDGFALSMGEYETLYRMAHEYIKTTKWDKIFLLKPKKKGIVDDGYRYMNDSDYEIRYKFYKHLKSLYDESGFEYEELDGNYYENYCRVKEYVEELYES